MPDRLEALATPARRLPTGATTDATIVNTVRSRSGSLVRQCYIESARRGRRVELHRLHVMTAAGRALLPSQHGSRQSLRCRGALHWVLVVDVSRQRPAAARLLATTLSSRPRTFSGKHSGQAQRWPSSSGDPAVAGSPFVIRFRYSTKSRIPPHWHPVDEHLTVLSGTFRIGMGEDGAEASATALGGGAYAAAGKDGAPRVGRWEHRRSSAWHRTIRDQLRQSG